MSGRWLSDSPLSPPPLTSLVPCQHLAEGLQALAGPRAPSEQADDGLSSPSWGVSGLRTPPRSLWGHPEQPELRPDVVPKPNVSAGSRVHRTLRFGLRAGLAEPERAWSWGQTALGPDLSPS